LPRRLRRSSTRPTSWISSPTMRARSPVRKTPFARRGSGSGTYSAPHGWGADLDLLQPRRPGQGHGDPGKRASHGAPLSRGPLGIEGDATALAGAVEDVQAAPVHLAEASRGLGGQGRAGGEHEPHLRGERGGAATRRSAWIHPGTVGSTVTPSARTARHPSNGAGKAGRAMRTPRVSAGTARWESP
jgi:hypothetical protein